MKSTEISSSISNYQVLLIDNEIDINIFSALLPIKEKAIEISSITQDDDIEMYFAQQTRNYQEHDIHALYVSANPKKLVVARDFRMDTCFLNNGINDFLDFDKTYEIPVTKKLTR